MNDNPKINEIVAAANQFSIAMQAWATALVAEVAPVLEQLREPIQRIRDYCRAQYDAIGAPYGPDDDAMWRWWAEQAAVERAREDAELYASVGLRPPTERTP